MFFEGCIRRLSAAVQIAIQCQHICGRAFAGHPQKAKKPPSGGIFYYQNLAAKTPAFRHGDTQESPGFSRGECQPE